MKLLGTYCSNLGIDSTINKLVRLSHSALNHQLHLVYLNHTSPNTYCNQSKAAGDQVLHWDTKQLTTMTGSGQSQGLAMHVRLDRQ